MIPFRTVLLCASLSVPALTPLDDHHGLPGFDDETAAARAGSVV